jgi:hypothetical protein
MKTPYNVLGVPRNATDEMIRIAFRKVAKAYHPDLNPGDPAAEQHIKQVIAAYEILKNPRRRMAYDQYLNARRRERVRRFGMSAAASLLCGIVVALAAILQPNTQEASALSPPSHMAPSHTMSAVSPDASQQVAAAAKGGHQEVNRDSKTDWRLDSDPGPRRRQQTAGNLALAAGPLEAYAVLTSGWAFKTSGEPMAFVGRAQESELARSGPIALIDRAAPPSSKLLKKPSLEDRASKFVATQIAGRSSANTSDLGSLTSAYADSVLYYGSRKSRQAVLLERRRELLRWPNRIFDVKHDSMMARCSTNVCEVRGTMAWQTRNGNRATMASRISKFQYQITPSGDGFRILSESGSVVKRDRQEVERNHGRRTKVTAHQQRCERLVTRDASRNPVDQSCAMRNRS